MAIDDIFSNLESMEEFRAACRPASRATALEASPAATARQEPQMARPTFPCQSCAGTGRFRGVRIHQPEERCFACDGRGFFYQSTQQRAEKRQARVEKKAARVANAIDEFRAAHTGLYEWLSTASWSPFLTSLKAQLDSGKALSDRQIDAMLSSKAKSDAKQVERQQERKAAQINVDLSAIESMFSTAMANGLKKPVYRANGVKISRAKESGTNAGALYVKDGETYLGKIVNKVFHPSYDGRRLDAGARLLAIADNPLNAAVSYGRLTGSCACCGRELTDPVSVARGIGPICADNWGL